MKELVNSFDKEVSFTNSQVKEKQNIWSEV